MKRPVVSIIVPALNAEDTIDDCITSLIGQDFHKDKYEIIIIDNGSTDNTLKLLRKYKGKIKLLCEPNIGSYYARNRGIRKASGEIILFTDSDCIAKKDWINQIIKNFNGKKIIVVSGAIKAAKKNTLLREYCDLFCHTQKEYHKIMKAATSNMAVRKKSIVEIGLFNDKIKSGGDFELCGRMIKKPEQIYFEKNAIIYHQYPKSILKFIKKSFYYGKWKRIIKKNQGFKSSKISYLEMLRKNKFRYIIFRFLQDVSYKTGCLIGIIISIKKRV